MKEETQLNVKVDEEELKAQMSAHLDGLAITSAAMVLSMGSFFKMKDNHYMCSLIQENGERIDIPVSVSVKVGDDFPEGEECIKVSLEAVPDKKKSKVAAPEETTDEAEA